MGVVRNWTCPLCGHLHHRDNDIDNLICYRCGNDDGKRYSIDEIKAYAQHWLKPSLSTDAMMCGEPENERLMAFIYYIGTDDSDGIEIVSKSSKWEKYMKLGKRMI